MQKQKRQAAIVELIGSHQIGTQEDLTEHLKNAGFFVNQSSVSRDLIELGVVKVNGFYTRPTAHVSNFGLIAMDTAGEQLIVAKTEPGMASAVCVRIDREALAEIVGTIAGEDTIFIALKDKRSQATALKKIWEMFEQG